MQIGSNLFITETMMKGHLRNIFTKLNILSRTEAVTVPSRRGLIELYRMELRHLLQRLPIRSLEVFLKILPPPLASPAQGL
jgi:regulatory LuxR family protein